LLRCAAQAHYFSQKPGELALALAASCGLSPEEARTAIPHYSGKCLRVLSSVDNAESSMLAIGGLEQLDDSASCIESHFLPLHKQLVLKRVVPLHLFQKGNSAPASAHKHLCTFHDMLELTFLLLPGM
jgi:hypothetical protein